MNRSQQIRQIYAELRTAVGNQATAGELLDCATSIAEAYREDDATGLGRGSAGRSPFWAEPLDSAFEDGGWRVMAFETGSGLRVSDEQESGSNTRRYKLRQITRIAA